MARPRSTFTTTLQNTRIVIDPYEMLSSTEYHMLSPMALGLLVRLLPYLGRAERISGIPDTPAILSRFAGVHVATLRKFWPELEPMFQRDENGHLRFVHRQWLTVQAVSGDRQNLRHLLNQLVAFWGSACAYCKNEDEPLHIEHIVPVIRGGSDDLTNLTLACPKCNYKKGRQTAAEFGFPHIHDIASRIQ
jgi:hypothetical protein